MNETLLPPLNEPRVVELMRPFQRFFELEAAGGILLLVCALIAMVWANSPWASSYFELWETTVTIGGGWFVLSKDLSHWINDGLMVIFFFVMGMEIKREMVLGELSSPKKAALPILAAVGGMVVPAGIFAALNWGGPGMPGWGIPMATDIAFAVGVLALVGRRAPLALKVFLLAIAIVDDLGAVLVIALFYTADLSMTALWIAAAIFALLVIMNRIGVHWWIVYIILGIGLWLATLESGVHATIAGVLLAMAIPVRRRIDEDAFFEHGEAMLAVFRRDLTPGGSVQHLTDQQMAAVESLQIACKEIQTPLARMEHSLVKWVAFFIMPIFALANAGVALRGDLGDAFANRVTLGALLGLLLGKQIGITLFSWLAIRTGLADMPAHTSWRQIYGVSLVCGIGFTMSLFIANLAFTGDNPHLLNNAKIGVLSGSVIAGIAGFLLLMRGKVLSEAELGTHKIVEVQEQPIGDSPQP